MIWNENSAMRDPLGFFCAGKVRPDWTATRSAKCACCCFQARRPKGSAQVKKPPPVFAPGWDCDSADGSLPPCWQPFRQWWHKRDWCTFDGTPTTPFPNQSTRCVRFSRIETATTTRVARYRPQRPQVQSAVSIQPRSCHSLPFAGWQRPDENVGGGDVVCGETWRRRRRRLPSSYYYFRRLTCFGFFFV